MLKAVQRNTIRKESRKNKQKSKLKLKKLSTPEKTRSSTRMEIKSLSYR